MVEEDTMGFLDRLFGTESPRPRRPEPRAALNPDEQAIERYRYMVRTAPPEVVEQAHAEAFAKLSPEQRRQVISGLASAAPAGEAATIAATSPDDPQAMARAATRAEIRQPGLMERTLGGAGGGFAGSLLSSFAMGFVGSMVANSFFSAMGGFGEDHGGSADAEANADDGATQDGDQLADYGGDDGGGFDGGGDFEA
jgi:hypothetical protein